MKQSKKLLIIKHWRQQKKSAADALNTSRRLFGLKHQRDFFSLVDAILTLVAVILIAADIFLAVRGPQLDFLTDNGNFVSPIGVINAKLDVRLVSQSRILTPGQKTNYIIAYENKNPFPLKNAEIVVYINNPMVKEKKLVFTQKEWAVLAFIGQNTQAQTEFSLDNQKIDGLFTVGEKNQTAVVSAVMTFETAQKKNTKGFSFSHPLMQKINTPFTVTAFARYFTDEGEPIGFGPVPPTAGQKTRYWIIFKIGRFNNDISRFRLTAVLADNVIWTNKISATFGPKIAYDQNRRQIIWQIDQLNPDESAKGDMIAAVELELTPDTGQVGQPADLISRIEITGQDDFTGREFHQILPNINTDLTNSDKNENSGGAVEKNQDS